MKYVYSILIIVAASSYGMCFSVQGSNNQKAGISGNSTEHLHLGPITVTAPSQTLLVELGFQALSPSVGIETSVRFEIEKSNQYKADNPHQPLPCLTTMGEHPSSDKAAVGKTLQEVYLTIPTAQAGQFFIKKTTIEHIPVMVTAEPFNIIETKPGGEACHLLPLTTADHGYYVRSPEAKKYFNSSDYTFTVPQDSTLTHFKVYLKNAITDPTTKTSQMTNSDTVVYYVNIKQLSKNINRKSDPKLPMMSLAPGESFIICTEKLLAKPLDSGTKTIEYTLDPNDYADEKVTPVITYVIDEKLKTKTWMLSIPQNIKTKPDQTFTGGKSTVNIKTTQFGVSALTPVFTVQVRNNK